MSVFIVASDCVIPFYGNDYWADIVLNVTASKEKYEIWIGQGVPEYASHPSPGVTEVWETEA